jgi:hypothetical protein
MVPRYVLQLLFTEKIKIAKNSTTTKASKKIITDLKTFGAYPRVEHLKGVSLG